nr:hypothetical protein [Burkholderia ambifaria]
MNRIEAGQRYSAARGIRATPDAPRRARVRFSLEPYRTPSPSPSPSPSPWHAHACANAVNGKAWPVGYRRQSTQPDDRFDLKPNNSVRHRTHRQRVPSTAPAAAYVSTCSR